MKKTNAMKPQLLVFDDLFGRSVPFGANTDRANLCAHFLWKDLTGDGAVGVEGQEVLDPAAEAVFCRAQKPQCAHVGDTVENDLEGALEVVRERQNALLRPESKDFIFLPWSMVLIDLCFYTGRVTERSHRCTSGMAEGRPEDEDVSSYFGLALLDAIHKEFPELPIFVLSSNPREEVSLEFSRRGALGFIARDDFQGPKILEEALWQHGLLPDHQEEVVGYSLPLLLALREARRACRHRENLFIQGERGTGKELLARYVHRMTGIPEGARERPFIPVNSAVFSPNLFSSELFGIEARTATGVDGKVGLIEMAAQGDLFLDEIADMPLEVQAALLRVLQERQVTPVGGRQPKAVDARFISATNTDLEGGGQSFRPDLLDRLRIGGTIWLPPLRERVTDIPLLTETFIRAAESQRKGVQRRNITPDALKALCAYDWPGNVRQLRSVVFDAVNRFPDVEHLVPGHLRLGARTETATAVIRVTPTVEPAAHSGPHPNSVGLEAVLRQAEEIRFDAQDATEWAGRLGDVQKAQAGLIASMLQAALEATKRRTPENPEGILQIHPALKLLTGDSTLTASQAADALKRLLGPLEEDLEGDLRDAYDTAVRLRPKSPRAKRRRKA